jgi:hypothetical protein
MKQEHILIFHSKTDNGWQPGKFIGHTRVTSEDAKRMNDHFPQSGVKVMPVGRGERNKFAPFHIE